jgi:hypothetical protein
MDLDTFIIAVFCWVDATRPQVSSARARGRPLAATGAAAGAARQ